MRMKVLYTDCYVMNISVPDLTCPPHNASIKVYQLLVKVDKI